MKQILILVVELYIVILVARALLSWFPATGDSPLIPVVRVLDRLTEPVLAPVRRLIHPIRAGGMYIDLSIIIVLLFLQIVVIRVIDVYL